jgi:hypothetical protein
MKDKATMKPRKEERSDDDVNAVISEQETDSQGSELRRSTRESQPVLRLKPNMSGISYVQNNEKTIKKVVFAEDKLKQLEYCHNLVSQVKPAEEQTIEYGSNQAMLIARFIQDITRNVNEHAVPYKFRPRSRPRTDPGSYVVRTNTNQTMIQRVM